MNLPQFFSALLSPAGGLLAGALLAALLIASLWRYLRWRGIWSRHFPSPRRVAPRILLALAGLLLLAAALYSTPPGDAAPPGRLMLVLDTSGSMRADDVGPSRFAAELAEAGDLINQAPESDIGVVEMNSAPDTVLVPTPDRNAARAVLAALGALPPSGGSDLDRAVAQAAGFLVPSGGRIVLMTDGERDQGANLVLPRRLLEKGIHLEIIGIGTPQGSLIPGKPAPAQLHEADLQALARQSGGSYRRLGAAPAADTLSARTPPRLPFDAARLCAFALAALAAAVLGGVPW
jgi:hypothetical protein